MIHFGPHGTFGAPQKREETHKEHMSNIKLTPAQKDVIQRMREGCVIYLNEKTGRCSFFRESLRKDIFDILLKLELIHHDGGYMNVFREYTLTDLGRTIEL